MFLAKSEAEANPPASAASAIAPCSKTQHKLARSRRGTSRLTGPCGLSLALVAVIFVVDLCLPLGVASAVPYSFAALLALKARPGWFGPFVAALCMVLTFLKMAIAPDRGTTELWKVITNRFLAIFAIGMTTFLGILRRRAEQERERADERLREHQAALAHMGRLTLLGQVAASVAHELNQPLAAIRLNAELAGRTVARDREPQTELAIQLRELSVQSARAGDIVHSIRRLARRSAFDPAPVDMNEVVATAVKLLEWRMKRAGIAIHIERHAESSLAFGDRIQLEQVIVNLLQNALESLANPSIPSKMIGIHIDRKGDQITVRVHDNGPGLAAGIALFEPFTTTKPDGLGLGLAICRSIIDAHGGRMSGTNLDSGGAEFSLTIPTAAKGQR